MNKLPPDILSEILYKIDNKQDYINLVKTSKIFDPIDHRSKILCFEPTKTEIFNWILNRLNTLRKYEQLTIDMYRDDMYTDEY